LPEEWAHLIDDETETAKYGRLNAFLRMNEDINASQVYGLSIVTAQE
jgi:hypothetical protein